MFRFIKYITLLITLCLSGVLSSQTLLNNGANIRANSGSYIYVNGSVENSNTGDFNVSQNAGIPAEMFVSQNITNNANLTGNGHIRLIGNWYNNSVFTSTTGTVFFQGANQILGGSVATHFFNITLDGSGVKTQTIDQFANGVLNLNHLELQTETHAFFMENVNTNAIQRTSGFVSSLNGGFLSRKTNTVSSYLFPVGSSLGVQRYRPVELTPSASTSNTYTVRMANVNATTESYNLNSKSNDICELNPLFYHQINRSSGSSAVKLDIFFDAVQDGAWEGISNWLIPTTLWDIVAGSTVTNGTPFSIASKTNWNNFSSQPYALHKSNVMPIFTNLGPYCVGDTPSVLPTTSINGLQGTWYPSTINTSVAGTTIYTFTPSTDVCGYVYQMTVIVNPNPVVNLGADINTCVNSIPITLDAGTGFNSYLWSTSQTTQTIQVSTTNTYSVTVSNAYGCTASDSQVVTVNSLPIVNISGLNPHYCENAPQVTLVGTPSGGSFSGSGILGNNFNASLAGVGTHNITYTYTDINGCTNSTSLNTQVSSVPELSIASTISPTCNGTPNGSISLNVTGGTPNFNYIWSPNTGTNGPNASNLMAGTYNITVEDAVGCSDNIQVQLVDPSAMNLSVNITHHVLCYGESNGSAVANISGGTPPYTYTWNNDNSHLSYNNNLPVGTWTVSVVDANLCSTFQQFTITQPTALSVQFSNVQNVSCNGMADGAAIAIVNGGTPSYQYLWNNSSHSNQATASNLPAGIYTVTITDANSCTTTNQVQITEPAVLSISASAQPVQCGINLGSVTAQATGGITPYSYQWTGGHTGSQVNGLQSGTYTVVVSDGNSCTASTVVTIGMQGNGVVHITQTQPILCHGDSNAILTAEMINGISPISYIWSNSNTGSSIQNLSAGIYSVTATDSWGCSGMQSQLISEPLALISAFNTSAVSCYGGHNGSANITISGGTSPYNYLWSNGSTDPTISQLTSGNYTITVSDFHNCTLVSSVNIPQPDAPIGVSLQVNHISCYGESDGSINANATGGTSPYQYYWEMGVFNTNTANINNLYQGLYNLTITDAHNCSFDTVVSISQPAALSASWSAQGPSCIGNNDGYIQVAAVGGTEPYQYSWKDGLSPVELISGLVEGNYIITVIDDHGCQTSIGPVVLYDRQEDCIKIPNAFTPNGDGVNDTWIIEHIELFPAAYVQVFNRWGQALYEAKGSEMPWDGTYHGKPVPPGPYIYIVELFTGNKPYTGIVTVLR